MITILTDKICFSLPDRFFSGKPISAKEANTLESIRLNRLKWIVSIWLSKGMSPSEVQSHLDAFSKTYEFSSRPLPDNLDPVALEALLIAKQLVQRKLRERQMELDLKTIELHAEQLAQMEPIRKRAERIVNSRRETIREFIK